MKQILIQGFVKKSGSLINNEQMHIIKLTHKYSYLGICKNIFKIQQRATHKKEYTHKYSFNFTNNVFFHSFIKVNDENSFKMARKLIKKEGLVIGGSSGTAMYAAIKAAKKLDKKQSCLVVLPDSIRNYLSKFVDDDWMKKNNFKE